MTKLTIQQAIEQAVALYQQDRLDDAESSLSGIQRQHPDIPYVLHLLALIALRTERPAKAVQHLEKAVAAEPGSADLFSLLGDSLKQANQMEAAVEAYQKAVALDPKLADVHYNLANTLKTLDRQHDAIPFYQRAVELKPDFADAYYNLGVALKAVWRSDEAVAAYRRVLALKPGDIEAINNLGNLFQEQDRLEDAVAAYQSAIALKPDYAESHFNLGNALKTQGMLADAIQSYREALRIDPASESARACLLEQLQHTADWDEIEDMEPKVAAFTRRALRTGDKVPVTPFAHVTRCDDPAENFAVARAHSREIAGQMSVLKPDFPAAGKRSAGSKITIGYLSSDFYDHATAHLMLSLFERHDREDFNIFTFSHGQNDASDYRAKIIEDSDEFFDIRDVSHLEAAKRIYESGVDILVDLKGFTQYNRLQICALRPAPLQATYLGFPGTTGADFMDYVLTDKIVSPEDHAPHYSEKFVYLPHCYQVNDHTQGISGAPIARADFGLPEDGFVFCSFNNSYKIEPVMFDVWMNLLKKAPNSVLWLYKNNDFAVENFRKRAEARGVEGGRLVFAEKTSKDRHLQRYGLVDLVLDCRLYGGHTTTSDALWAGVPVVALQGAHFASRVSSSLLAAIGLPELVTHSLADYEALGLRLSQDPGELQALKAKLAQNRLSEPLFDTPRFARNLENAYRLMWERYLAGKSPARIDVVEDDAASRP